MSDERKRTCVVFSIPSEPTGKGRPRFSTFNGHVRAVTPQQTVLYENLVKTMYAIQCCGYRFGDDERLEMRIAAYYAIPKSASKKKRADMIAGIIRPCKKPDMDNVIKIIADALNEIAYKDDAQIVDTVVSKFYAEEPHVDVVIRIAEEGETIWKKWWLAFRAMLSRNSEMISTRS